ncbi:MAG: hypothetical protein AB8H86_20320 [Polyangiales bacterium]
MSAASPVSPPSSASSVALRSLRAVWVLGLVALTCGPLEALTASYGDDLNESLPPRGRAHFDAMEAHFAEDFSGYSQYSVLTPQFSIILLSHSALGFLNVARASPDLQGRACESLDRVAERAFDSRVSPYERDPRDVGRFEDYNLYLTHLSLVLGARRMACGREASDDAFHARINAHVRERSLTSHIAHARSFPHSERFPADQAATLASLHLYDLTHDTQLAQEPIEVWLRTMALPENLAEHGLHRSCLDDEYPHAAHARGCALSWTSFYMPQFAPEEARVLYETYRAHYAIEVAGLSGFREYAPGVDGETNADSGPIVLGMGVAATGLALGAARLQGDSQTYQRLMQTAATAGAPNMLGVGRSYWLAPMLGEAILFHATTAKRWDGPEVQGTPYERGTPWGTLAYAAFLLFLIWRTLRELWKDRRTVKKSEPPTSETSEAPAEP